MVLKYDIQGGDFVAAGRASSEVKRILKQLSIDPQLIRKIVISLYEAEVNVVAHAYKGVMEVEFEHNKIAVQVKDEGPGIPDISKAMEEGFSTASEEVRQMGFGAGMGLPNIRKNTDEMELTSTVGSGTTLTFSVFI